MQFEYLSLFFIIIIMASIGVILLLRKKDPGTISLSILVATVAVWILAVLLFEFLGTPVFLSALKAINYLCMAAAATAQFYFSLSYANRTRWLSRTTIIFFLLQPAITQILFWVDPLRMIFFNATHEVWHQFNLFYVICLLAGSIVLFIDTFLHKPRSHFFRAGTILLGSFFPLIGSLLLVFSHYPQTNVYISVLSYSLAISGFSYGIFNGSLIETTPSTRELIIESMDDGWMVIDQYDKVIDLNSSAEKKIGLSRERIYGQPVDQILTDWSNIIKSSEGVREMEMRRSTKTKSDWRYLNVRISQLRDKTNKKFGHLIVWRDITERKLSDDARQRARDELFVLLNAISGASSRSMKLEEFLSESIYQILYSFNSQVVAIFLTTDKEEGSRQKLLLKSHLGIPPEYMREINNDTLASSIFDWLANNEENRPLIIENFQISENVPFTLKNIGISCAVMIPLIIYTQHENAVLGCLCLGRNEDVTYTKDEVIRLTTISNQIAALIDSNRRRQFTIALTERQRILRDLHDSVSQKLYGLVALTEAAQAGIEAGSEIPPLQILTRIGENARQAVKEMRLFLYEMQPVDLKEGLVSSLHHRLAAVEGRADIKARLLTDENIQLSKDGEIALYYIAQEALNNILRHAHAKSISVNLKQTRQNVILEIIDDGNGFNIKKIDNSGMGLRNMKERTQQINGKIKIVSAVGKGTKITVTVSRKGRAT